MDVSEDEIPSPPLSRILSLTGSTDAGVACQFMEMSGNDLGTAAGLFAEMMSDGGLGGEVAGGAEVGGGGGGGSDNQRDNVVIDGFESSRDACDDEIVTDELDEGHSIQTSEPDYDHLLVEDGDDNDSCDEYGSHNDNDDGDDDDSDDVASSTPDYDHLGEVEELASTAASPLRAQHHDGMMKNNTHDSPSEINTKDGNDYDAEGDVVDEDDDLGEEYILGTMMVRVLQARDIKASSLSPSLTPCSNVPWWGRIIVTFHSERPPFPHARAPSQNKTHPC
jgi:hypothetical protein